MLDKIKPTIEPKIMIDFWQFTHFAIFKIMTIETIHGVIIDNKKYSTKIIIGKRIPLSISAPKNGASSNISKSNIKNIGDSIDLLLFLFRNTQ